MPGIMVILCINWEVSYGTQYSGGRGRPQCSDLIRMYLEKEGFDVRIAYDGGKAVEEYDRQAPDMVLLDIMLPVMDGWSVCAHIREKARHPSSC